MIPKHSFSLPIGVLTLAVAIVPSMPSGAQPPPVETAITWQDLGFSELPSDFSTDMVPLFKGLNESRGTWSFEGKSSDGDKTSDVEGRLSVAGNPSSGMVPMWKVSWGWPADDPEYVIIDSLMATPRKTGFDLMLFRVGPMKPPRDQKPGTDTSANAKPKTKIRPSMFRGKWDLKSKTISWTESELPKGIPDQGGIDSPATPKRSFEMVIASDGKITIQNSKDVSGNHLSIASAMKRTGKPPATPVSLNGKHQFQTVAEIRDQRIRPTLPPQATEISLLSTRGGHFARYKISKADLTKFLDDLWAAKKDSSAHQRDHMSGEGERVKRDAMIRRFKPIGWEPLKNAVSYYSPSKSNGAMTTYYFDEEAGIAYHDTGYW